jgi:hypothetical protein
VDRGQRLLTLVRRLPRLYSFEIVTLVAVVAAVVFLRAEGLRIDGSTIAYTIPPVLKPTGFALLCGIPLQLLYRALTRQPLRAYLRQVFTPRWLLLWARLWLAYIWISYQYLWLKVSIPLVNHHLHDAALWRLDQLFHLGISPSLFATHLFAGSPLLGLLDRWYGWWLITVFYGVAFFSASDDELFRRRFMLSSVLIWSLGPWLYTAVPALGPCYADPQTFAAVRVEMPRAAAAQDMLRENYERVLAGREGGALRQFNPTRGVASFPSLHVGLHFLLALWAWREARPMRVLWVIATGLTFVGSVVSGWHYAIDGYAGAILAWAAYRLALRVERDPAAAAVVADGGPAATAG